MNIYTIKTDFKTHKIIEITKQFTASNRKKAKVINRGGSVRGLFFEVHARDTTSAVIEYHNFAHDNIKDLIRRHDEKTVTLQRLKNLFDVSSCTWIKDTAHTLINEDTVITLINKALK